MRSKVIVDVLVSKLGVQCSSIARIHRLGRTSGKRPVIMFFQDYTEKQAVLRNVSKLKGTTIYIRNDYSQCTLSKRRLLWETAKADKTAGKRVSLVNDKLRVNNEFYVWDELTNERVKLPSFIQPEPVE